MKHKPATCRALLKDYCANCTFAGIHFIADDSKHWLERLLWILLVILSWYGSALLIIAAYHAFIANPISFGVETTYLNWDTKMPAVAICENKNEDKIYNVSDTLWTLDHIFDLEDVLRDIAFFRGVAPSLVEICLETDDPDPNCPTSNYRYYSDLVRQDRCDQLIKRCSYNMKEFPCCDYFQAIETDMGNCFILNSMQTKKPNPYPMINNMKQKSGKLRFEVWYSTMTVYTLGEDEVPTVTTTRSSTLQLSLGHSFRRLVSVRHIVNDPDIVDTIPEQRACRFDYEFDSLYPRYSYSACVVKCRKKGQLDMCGCNDHFMLDTAESDRCNITGLACLTKYSAYLTTLKPPWNTRPGLVCNCLPSCNETEITVIKDVTKALPLNDTNNSKSHIEIILSHIATERFKRNVVRSRLDLVVSVGGTTGLFVGASVLSFVELIFYFTVRLLNNVIWMRKQKKREYEELINKKICFRNEIQGNVFQTQCIDITKILSDPTSIRMDAKHMQHSKGCQIETYHFRDNLDSGNCKKNKRENDENAIWM